MTIQEFVMNIALFATIVTVTFQIIKAKLIQGALNINTSMSIGGIINVGQLASWVYSIVLAWVLGKWF